MTAMTKDWPVRLIDWMTWKLMLLMVLTKTIRWSLLIVAWLTSQLEIQSFVCLIMFLVKTCWNLHVMALTLEEPEARPVVLTPMKFELWAKF